ncbi:MAG: MmgE/PrpD family protein [Betaproteobacteria bacterium]|nr:MmgE/PrpD family protein [Betaproteobacteria bacterium]
MTLESRLLDHAEAMHATALPPRSMAAAVAFITDSIGVGLAGGRHPRLEQVRAAASQAGRGDDATEWSSGRRMPAPSAALLNAWQIHNQEFDCVHEAAVVHPMATILPALLAVAERQERADRAVSGARLIEAVVLAVDVAATIGVAQAAPMRFFRPAMCGALGASLGLVKLVGGTREQMADALGIAYSMLAGTMQAHREGSPMLALQIGIAARSAVTALDLALTSFAGPRDVLEGPFGYYELFDKPLAPRRDAVAAVFARLGQHHRIEELSHKPQPTGRAAQGALDGLARLRREYDLGLESVAEVELRAPPLVLRLVGRPLVHGMDVNYARLCLPYLAATMLERGAVDLDDFSPEALASPARAAFAPRVRWVDNGHTDPNALAPQTVRVRTRAGGEYRIELPAVLGHPDQPLSPKAQRAKFDACCHFAGLAPARSAALHAELQGLPSRPSLAGLSLLASP